MTLDPPAVGVGLLAEIERLRAVNAELVALAVEAAEFIQPFNRARELLDRIEAALAKTGA